MSKFVDDRHNLYCGWVFGLALKYDLPLQPIYDEDGIVTDRMLMALPNGITIEIVVPPPPDDWQLGKCGADVAGFRCTRAVGHYGIHVTSNDHALGELHASLHDEPSAS